MIHFVSLQNGYNHFFFFFSGGECNLVNIWLDTNELCNISAFAITIFFVTMFSYAEHFLKKFKDYRRPHFNLHLRDIFIVEGSAARLDCKVTGVPEPNIRWWVFCFKIS